MVQALAVGPTQNATLTVWVDLTVHPYALHNTSYIMPAIMPEFAITFLILISKYNRFDCFSNIFVEQDAYVIFLMSLHSLNWRMLINLI